MKCENDQVPVPQAEEQIEKAIWVTREGLAVKLANTYPSIREVFLRAFND
jgi:hypothetical protein